jgi:Holliday junction DNA helicase RuvB
MTKPKPFHGFIGQRRKIAHLTQQLAGSQAQGKPFPHCLFKGLSGMGKTKLALALAEASGTNCRILHSKVSPRELCEAAVQLAKGDFLFLDEAHRLPKETQEAIYELTDHYCLSDRLEKGSDAEKIAQRDDNGKLIISPCTVVLATDQPHTLLQALRNRMKLSVALDDYRVEDLIEIAFEIASAKDTQLLISSQALRIMAQASQNRPRQVRHILRQMRNHFHADREHQLTNEDVRKFFRSAGLSDYGLDDQQQKCLHILYDRGRASLQNMASMLGTDVDDLRCEIEPGLVKLGLIDISPSGRSLTPDGRNWVERQLKTPQAE